jgi:hypothetical protein
MVRFIVAMVLILFGAFIWYQNGFGIATIAFFTLCCFIAGLFGGGISNEERTSQNISELAQIERNRYFRKPEE